MKNNNNIKKVRKNMILWAIVLESIEIVAAVLWACTGIWLPFVIYTIFELIIVFMFFIPYYYKKVSFTCPTCNEVFKPTYKEMFWANHTFTKRKLTCPHCNEKKWCVEVYDESSNK